MALVPASIGHQDLAAFFARQPGVSQRWRDHLIASPFGTIHAATFSFSRPIGTAIPEPVGAQPVNFDPRSLDVKTWSGDDLPSAGPALWIEYPTVNRAHKGDRLPLPQQMPDASEPASAPQLQPIEAPSTGPTAPPAETPRPKNAERLTPGPGAIELEIVTDAFGSLAPAPPAPPAEPAAGVPTAELAPQPVSDVAAPNETVGALPPANADRGSRNQAALMHAKAAEGDESLDAAAAHIAPLASRDEDAAGRTSNVYFSTTAMGTPAGLEQWRPGDAPVEASPTAPADIRLSALDATLKPDVKTSPKLEATWFRSPADRLGLSGKPRAKAEKCIADAVYFEARGEPLRGQMAVAQVVMNRVFSGRYPNDVCGVVYQNAHRRLACQFTFACEGKDLSRIDEPDMWAQARRIAKDALDGKIWLAEVGHATHYHAYWVRPSWVREMSRLYKLGVHTFYRPRAWGDGSDSDWSNVTVKPKSPDTAVQNPAAAKAASPAAGKIPEAAAKTPQPQAAVPAADKKVATARL